MDIDSTIGVTGVIFEAMIVSWVRKGNDSRRICYIGVDLEKVGLALQLVSLLPRQERFQGERSIPSIFYHCD